MERCQDNNMSRRQCLSNGNFKKKKLIETHYKERFENYFDHFFTTHTTFTYHA